jgi:hypothetical protein
MSSMRDFGLPARSHQTEATLCLTSLGGWQCSARHTPTIVIVIVVVLTAISPSGQIAGVLYALATVLALAGMRPRVA